MQIIHQVLFNGYYVEAGITYLSKNVIVNGVAKSLRWVDTNMIDWLVNATVPFANKIFKFFRIGHTGRIGDYMGTFAIGVTIIVIAILIIVKGV
jgi:NADH-quinone oxidoreductase subunit L